MTDWTLGMLIVAIGILFGILAVCQEEREDERERLAEAKWKALQAGDDDRTGRPTLMGMGQRREDRTPTKPLLDRVLPAPADPNPRRCESCERVKAYNALRKQVATTEQAAKALKAMAEGLGRTLEETGRAYQTALEKRTDETLRKMREIDRMMIAEVERLDRHTGDLSDVRRDGGSE